MTKEQIVVALIAIARAAHSLADDTCDEDDILTVDRADFNALSFSLDVLDSLADPPGEVSTGPRKAEYYLLEHPTMQPKLTT